jgi:hypothetical protein
MSRLFGDIRQIAFVVASIDESMHYWSETLGVGPFFVQRLLTLQGFRYHGKPQASPTISIALAQSGALQIELIQQHDDLTSLYHDYLMRGRTGLQHVCSWVTCMQFDRLTRELLAAGRRLAQEGTIPCSGVRLAYFTTERGPGTLMFEVSDLADARHERQVRRVTEAALAWDGTDPIRDL